MPGGLVAPVNSILALALLVSCVGLIAAVLLQSRGAGLGATFGGESSVYRSRRGVEKRLFQFTVVLTVLFVGVSMVAFLASGSTF